MTEPTKGRGGDSGASQGMRRVFTLIKLFEKREYAEAMLRGHLHMNSLRFFREYRDANGDERRDAYEGVGTILQPSKLSALRYRNVVIPAKELAAPVLIHPENYSDWNVFCMFAVTNDGLLNEAISPSTLNELKKAMQIHEQCYGLGQHAVLLTDCNAFLTRAGVAFGRLGRGWRRNLVQYYDETAFHGTFDEDDVPFRKPKRFRAQREYRFAVQAEPGSSEHLEVELGDLSDIAQITTPAWINANLTLELRQPRFDEHAGKGS
jgi:hypothetical protein